MGRKHTIDLLRYRFEVKCCDVEWSWLGRAPDVNKTMYLCPKCRKEMASAEIEVRTLEACELIVSNWNRFTEECLGCGMKQGHHVVYHEQEDAYFLHCGTCKSELREIDKEEIICETY